MIYLGLADYLIGASNSRKRSRGSTVVKPLEDDAKVEDASEKGDSEKNCKLIEVI